MNTRRFPVILHILKFSERQKDLFEATLTFNGQTYGPLNMVYDPALGTIKLPGWTNSRRQIGGNILVVSSSLLVS